MNKINFGNPLNGRKWLSLLESNQLFGMTFKKKLHFDKSNLGFSFESNEFGLRGPKNINANTVICGTSYAMGLSVDNGKNWYELDDFYSAFFNIGMPIGFKHHLKLLETYYKGDYDTLLLIYHPNIWVTNKNFYNAEKENLNIFSYMKWQTGILKTLYLYLRWLVKEKVKILLHKKEIVHYLGKKYHLNLSYSYFSTKDEKNKKQILKDFYLLSNKFKRVIIYKVPIKEEVAFKYLSSEGLQKLNSNYAQMWNFFQHTVLNEHNTKVYDFSDKFDLGDYLEQDTHWNENGNIKFSKYLLETLKSENIC